MNKIILSKEINPYYNLSLEEELLYQVKGQDVIFYLWQNEKTVVIGRNQNPWLECQLDMLKREKIHLARRISGGGAVFHDLGNLNFTFVTRKENSNLEKQLSVLTKALNKLGIQITYSGRNDLLANGRKFSGHAFYEDEGYYFHHGTLMVNVDFHYLTKILTPSKLKLQSKGIQSVKSRVINLIEIKKDLSIESLKSQLIQSFQEVYGKVEKIQEVSKDSYIPKKFGIYQEEEWIYGQTPAFDVVIEEYIDKGLVQVMLSVEEGKIIKAKIFTDALETLKIEKLEKQLIGMAMQQEHIKQLISTL